MDAVVDSHSETHTSTDADTHIIHLHTRMVAQRLLTAVHLHIFGGAKK